MKVAKKSKGVVSVNNAHKDHEQKKAAKKESFITWFIRVTENHAKFWQAVKAIEESSKAIFLSLHALHQDNLVGSDVVDGFSEEISKVLASLDKYNSILLKRRRERMISNIEAGKQKKEEPEDAEH